MTDFFDLCSVFKKRADAVAFVRGSSEFPEIKGRVLFYSVPKGVIVRAEISGLPKKEGECDNPVFAFHIHSGGECSGNETDPFADAGTHYNPEECPHPYHAGDLPPLFGAGGKAFSAFLTDRISIKEILGRTIIIHSRPDDFTTQPSGNSGEKIACGVIKSVLGY
ncbi:MAG: superoxide dismutase family protein [Acutalibacteraceae bacterium]